MSDMFKYLLYEDEGGIDTDVRVEADHIMVMMSDVKDPSKMVCVKFGSEVDSGLDWVKTYLDILKQQVRILRIICANSYFNEKIRWSIGQKFESIGPRINVSN